MYAEVGYFFRDACTLKSEIRESHSCAAPACLTLTAAQFRYIIPRSFHEHLYNEAAFSDS